MTTGVETTTGPLGQGCANSVGMAIAAQALAQRFNRPGFDLFDYDVYALCGDGDMMEGVSAEAASLAGHLALSNLCWIYDSNHISIEGSTDLAFTEDVGKRFEAYGWNVIHVRRRQRHAGGRPRRSTRSRRPPTSPPSSSSTRSSATAAPAPAASKAHGEPLGEDNISRATKKAYGWPEDAQFLVPDGVEGGVHRRHHRARHARGAKRGRRCSSATREAHPATRPRPSTSLREGKLPDGWDKRHPELPRRRQGHRQPRFGRQGAERASPSTCPILMGGAADLSPSTKTDLKFQGAGSFEPGDYSGRNLHFGVREHAMGAIANGMTLTYLRGYTGTFLVFARLHARADPAGGDHGSADRLRLHPRLASASARTARPTSRSSISPRCAPSPGWTRSAPATRTRRRSRGRSRSSTRTSPPR